MLNSVQNILEGLNPITERSRGVGRLKCPSLFVVRVPRLIAGSPTDRTLASTVTAWLGGNNVYLLLRIPNSYTQRAWLGSSTPNTCEPFLLQRHRS